MSELGFGLLRPTQVINFLFFLRAENLSIGHRQARGRDSFIFSQIQQFIAFWSFYINKQQEATNSNK